MVRIVFALGLGLSVAAWSQDSLVEVRIRSVPADAAVFSIDGSQRYSESAAQGFRYDPARLKVGKTTLSQASFLLRKSGYRDASVSIPSEQVLYAPEHRLEWPQGESVVTLTRLSSGFTW